MTYNMIIFLCLTLLNPTFGQTTKSMRRTNRVKLKQSKDKKVIYEYKKFEEFDFDSLDIEGNVPTPGDLSIQQRYKKNFKNKIPERKEFNRMLENSIDTLK
jgi:hypothetical protein